MYDMIYARYMAECGGAQEAEARWFPPPLFPGIIVVLGGEMEEWRGGEVERWRGGEVKAVDVDGFLWKTRKVRKRRGSERGF